MNAHARAETCAFRSGASASSGRTSLGQLGLDLEARQLEVGVACRCGGESAQEAGGRETLAEMSPQARPEILEDGAPKWVYSSRAVMYHEEGKKQVSTWAGKIRSSDCQPKIGAGAPG